MSNIDQFSVVTLIFSLLSTVFVIKPFSFHVPVPMLGRQKVTLALIAAPIIALCILWAFQFIGATQIRDGIIGTDNVKPYNIFIPSISLAYMALLTLEVAGILQSAAFWVRNMGRRNGRILFFCFYLLLTSISMVIGNDPVILFVTVANLDPLAWLTIEVAGANTASIVLFVGNSVICEGSQVNKTVFLVQYTMVAESVNPFIIPILLISFPYMLTMFDDTGIRESAASSFISIGGNNAGSRLFLYFYLLVCGSIVLGKDPIILTFLVAVAWFISGFPASNTTNKYMVATFHGVENLTVNGGTFITNLTDIPAQVQRARAQPERMQR